MPDVSFRVYAELNVHLPREQQQVQFSRTITDGATVGEALVSLGIPLNEIDLLLVNGESTALSYCLREGDRVSAYPSFDSIDVTPVTRIENRPPRRLRFVLDVQLGKLAHHLRMLGFDTVYRNDYSKNDLLDIAKREDRILLSTSRKLVEGNDITAGTTVRPSDPRRQLIEILERFDLWGSVHPFQRCLHCNTVLRTIQRDAVLNRLPPKVRGHYLTFTLCASCGRVYWEGTHFAKMMTFIGEIFAERGPGVRIAPRPP